MTLIAHYRNVADGVDATGSLSGTPTNVTSVAGKVGLGGSFNGSSSKVALPDSTSLDFGNGTTDSPFSISCWLYWNAAAYAPIVIRANSARSQYAFRVNAAGQIALVIFDYSTSANRGKASANGAVTTEAWIHLAATYDGRGGTSAQNGIVLYKNGVNVNNSDISANTYVAMENTSAVPEIGYYDSGAGLWLNGVLDDVRIYNNALAIWQVQSIYNLGVGTYRHDPWRKSFGGIYLRGAA